METRHRQRFPSIDRPSPVWRRQRANETLLVDTRTARAPNPQVALDDPKEFHPARETWWEWVMRTRPRRD